MDHKNSIYYIAGLLDSRGGFYIVNRKKRKYIYFKISIKNHLIKTILSNFFIEKLEIDVRDWNGVLNITDTDGIQKLVEFMNNYCLRTDYKEMILQNINLENQNI